MLRKQVEGSYTLPYVFLCACNHFIFFSIFFLFYCVFVFLFSIIFYFLYFNDIYLQHSIHNILLKESMGYKTGCIILSQFLKNIHLHL